MKKAALYARVSTGKGQDVDLQLMELREFALKRGWQAEEYVDSGESGAKVKRPALDKLLKDAKARKIDVVIVWKLDRLGRSLPHLLHMLTEFEALGVAFVSLRENIDMTTPSGRLMAHLIGAFAEFEREIIGERVKAGIEAARRKGKRVGRKPTPAVTLKKIIELHQDPQGNHSLREIATKAKTSVGTVQRTIEGYRKGLIDRDGLKLIPEGFTIESGL